MRGKLLDCVWRMKEDDGKLSHHFRRPTGLAAVTDMNNGK